MRILILVSICLSMAVDTWAQMPEPCVSPPLLVGNVALDVDDGAAKFKGKLTYDALGEKLRIRAYGRMDDFTDTVDKLMYFKEGYYYEIHWDTFQCEKKRLDGTFQPLAVPSDATFAAQEVLGSSSEVGTGLLINTWSGEAKRGTYIINFTAVGCIPVSGVFYSAPQSWASWSMYNVVIGVQDPMSLIPPFFCEGAPLDETAEKDTFFTAVRRQRKNYKEFLEPL